MGIPYRWGWTVMAIGVAGVDPQEQGKMGLDGRASGTGKMLITGKTHQCPYCDYITTNYAHLLRHVRKHTGEKPFACPHCPFRATQNDNLKRHIRTHTGEKPFACAQCPCTFADKSSLKSHLWNHHN
ncbi:uncharacterized protein [Panulirus ornatus]|uniref:uncharacterized protein n=1 Tax=Panulirus ornatus TaxID=150431 RepID=UPI003A8C5BFF